MWAKTNQGQKSIYFIISFILSSQKIKQMYANKIRRVVALVWNKWGFVKKGQKRIF